MARAKERRAETLSTSAQRIRATLEEREADLRQDVPESEADVGRIQAFDNELMAACADIVYCPDTRRAPAKRAENEGSRMRGVDREAYAALQGRAAAACSEEPVMAEEGREGERAEWHHQEEKATAAQGEGKKRGRGRAAKFATEEERKAARKATLDMYKAKKKQKLAAATEDGPRGRSDPGGPTQMVRARTKSCLSRCIKQAAHLR